MHVSIGALDGIVKVKTVLFQAYFSKIAAPVDEISELGGGIVFGLAVCLPEGVYLFIGMEMQEEDSPVGERVAPGGTVEVEDGSDLGAAFFAFHQDVDSPEIAVEQMGVGDFVEERMMSLGAGENTADVACV